MQRRIKIFLTFLITGIIASSIVFFIYYFLENQISNNRNPSSIKIKSSEFIKNESCLKCHGEIIGIEDSHSPQKIGCYSCHLGNPNSLIKREAHANIILIPGNISDVDKTCGSANCHPQMIPRMKNNIMNTMNGVVTVDKWVFDEGVTPTFKNSIQEIKYSYAEKHLRNLCASCHLENVKTELGPINELSRGGGCVACHLNYSKKAFDEINQSKKQLTKYHPNVTIKINNQHCFGCHSRSGRISLSYDGWHETLHKPEEVKSKIGFRILDDGRVVQQIKKDIHSENGLICVDCHNSYEIMGDGNYYLHKEDQLQIRCTDCHPVSESKTQPLNHFEYESKKITELLGFGNRSRKYLQTEKGIPYTNAFFENGKDYLIKKSNNEKIEIKKPSFACTEGKAHKDLSCTACHNSWTPQCVGCHTEYDGNSTMYDLLENKEAEGEWIEHPKDMLAELTTLGVRLSNGEKEIIEVMPGMILTINKSKAKNTKFKRLFAPAFSHTIRKESKTCVDCHLNPLTLGYGRGKLEYIIEGKSGKWKFTPKYKLRSEDNLPEDAWIGFLMERKNKSATRENIRTFTIEEQKRILLLGSCLTCHKSDSKIIKATLFDFEKVLKIKSSNCILPKW